MQENGGYEYCECIQEMEDPRLKKLIQEWWCLPVEVQTSDLFLPGISPLPLGENQSSLPLII